MRDKRRRFTPHHSACFFWFFAFAPLVALLACREQAGGATTDESPPPARHIPLDVKQNAEMPVPTAGQKKTKAPPDQLVVSRVSQLEDLDLSRLTTLDLALSIPDSYEYPEHELRLDDTAPLSGPEAQAQRCQGLDLVALARQTPRLHTLRISGCQTAVHVGLGAFGRRLLEIELADLNLDGMTVARLVQLVNLKKLTLTRVNPEAVSYSPLTRTLPISHLTLRELNRDSVLADLLGDLPGLTHAKLEGAWAGHRAMLSLAKASRLESLTLVETSIGNFSLNRIRALTHLRKVDWTGSNFNNNSPIYLRDLSVEHFRCSCPRFGDGGLRILRLSSKLRRIDLLKSQISGAGLNSLTDLKNLETLHIGYREVDEQTFEALAKIKSLRRLHLEGGPLIDPEAKRLGELIGLENLTLDLSSFDDRAAPQLATLINLRSLDLGHTRISDVGLASLKTLTQLEDLRLHHTQITNRGISNISGLTKLRRLELDHTDLVDAGVSHLAKLVHLQDLRLDATLITDASIDSLAGLHELTHLNLANTVVSDAALPRLRLLPSLRALNLEGTRVRGQTNRKR